MVLDIKSWLLFDNETTLWPWIVESFVRGNTTFLSLSIYQVTDVVITDIKYITTLTERKHIFQFGKCYMVIEVSDMKMIFEYIHV